jgi:hypothetical protein
LQLGATLILTILRAWLRHHVGSRPFKAIQLTDGLEASHLSCSLEKCDCYMITQDLAHFAEKPAKLELAPIITKVGVLGAKFKKDERVSPAKRVWNRIFKEHKLISEIQPVRDDIFKTANNIYDAILDIVDILMRNSPSPLVSDILCHQYLVVKVPPGMKKEEMLSMDAIYPIPLAISINFYGLIVTTHIDREISKALLTREKILAILSFTIYSLSGLEGCTPHPDKSMPSSLRIIGHCKDHDHELESKRSQIHTWLGTETISNWTRAVDGRITDFKDGPGKDSSLVFGLPYSSIFQDR